MAREKKPVHKVQMTEGKEISFVSSLKSMTLNPRRTLQHFLEFLDLLFCDNPLWHVFLLLLLSCTSPYVRVLPYTCKIKEGISNALFPDFFLLFGIYIYFHPSCFTPRCNSNSNIAISVASLSRIFPVLMFVSAS